MVWIIISLSIFLITFPGSCELLFLTIGGILPRKDISRTTTHLSRLVVIVPAHNEAAHIAKTIESLKNCEDAFEMVIIADNCTDNTAKIVSELGVKVIERNDLNHRGKNFALDFAFNKLLKENYDVFVVIDADTTVQKNFISSIKRHIASDTPAIQTRYHLNSTSQLTTLAFLAYNFLRPRGRQFWGMSAGILGNGFALHKSVLIQIPYAVDSVVEDLSYHLKLVENGIKVRFVEDTSVFSDSPQSHEGKLTQRQRWEGGRLKELFLTGPHLLKKILSGHISLIEPLLDLMLLPLSYHTCLLFLLIFMSAGPLQLYGYFALGIVGLHFAAAIYLSEEKMKNSLSLILAPAFMLWKVIILPKIVWSAFKDNTWIRTKRDQK